MAHVPRVYCPDALHAGQTLEIEGARAHHLTRVLKRQVGDALVLFGPPDREHLSQITGLERNRISVAVGDLRQVQTESALRSVLVQGISRGDRMDYSVQKCVELGVFAIQPVLTTRSGVQLDDKRLARKQEHWQAIALSATEQSGRTQVPQIRTCQRLDQYFSARDKAQPGFVLCFSAQQSWGDAPQADQAIELLVGPEGGLDDKEVQLAQVAGLRPLQLGPRILRTETAGAAAITAIQCVWGDWRRSD
jgi:16S rRNA (uracil1498-N3)-methyltransferase